MHIYDNMTVKMSWLAKEAQFSLYSPGRQLVCVQYTNMLTMLWVTWPSQLNGRVQHHEDVLLGNVLSRLYLNDQIPATTKP